MSNYWWKVHRCVSPKACGQRFCSVLARWMMAEGDCVDVAREKMVGFLFKL